MDEPKVDRKINLNVLDFWKANQFRYPELSILARDVLSIPISTVASEASFSVGGRVLDQYRSALKPKNVEALICTRDWIFGDQGIFPIILFIVFVSFYHHLKSYGLNCRKFHFSTQLGRTD